MSVDEYYYGDPLLFDCYLEAYEFKRKQIEYDKWDIGAYVKCALNSSIFLSTPLLDNASSEKARKNLPNFPERPNFDNDISKDKKVLTGEALSNEEVKKLKIKIEEIKNGRLRTHNR